MTRHDNKLVLVDRIPTEGIMKRAAAIPRVTVEYLASAAELDARIEAADAIAVGELSPATLLRGRRLQWVHSWAAGPDSLLFPEMVTRDIVLTCCKGNGAVPLAEHAMMLMLMLNRKAVDWLQAQRERRWGRHKHGELNGQVCGIIGLGYSGQDLARKAKAFHMQVIGLRRSPQPTPYVDEVLPPNGLACLLERSDFVVVTTPITPETAGMIGEEQLRLMKPSAALICFSRGGIVDETALVRALQEGWIAGAGIDAFALEPLPTTSPLWDAPNTILTPHNGATTDATVQRGFEIFLSNLAHYASNLPLVNVVDKNAGY
jgi:phosphoglycerate dehydrogenase-like enzyme